jgi:hypothetical protein
VDGGIEDPQVRVFEVGGQGLGIDQGWEKGQGLSVPDSRLN